MGGLNGARRLAPALGLFAATQALYMATLHRGLPPLDGAEYVTAALFNGVAHPPGYPLFTLLGILFAHLPFGAPEARVNYLSAFCGSAAVALVYLAGLELTADAAAAAVAAATLGAGAIFWRYAVVAEVFTLHCVLVAALLLTALAYRRRPEARLLYLTAFLFGLGIAHLHTIVLIAPPLAWLLADASLLRRPARFWLALAGAFAAGLLPYAYLPWAAARHPAVNAGDPSTWARFLDVLLRRAYGTTSLAPATAGGRSAANMLAQLGHFGAVVFRDQFGLGLAVAALGARRLWARERRLAQALLLYLALNLPFFLWLANAPPTDLFYQVIQKQYGGPLIVLALLTAAGLAAVFEKFPKDRARAAGLAAVLPLAMAAANDRAADRSRDRFAENMGRLVLDTVRPDALIFSCSDTMFFTLRHMLAAGEAPAGAVSATFDASALEADDLRRRLPGEGLPDGAGTAFSERWIARAAGRRPVYFTFGGKCQGEDLLTNVRPHLVPEGLVFRWLPQTRPDLVAPVLEHGARELATQPEIFATSVGAQTDAGVKEIVGWYADAYSNLGVFYRLLGREADAARFLDAGARLRR